MSDRDKPLLQVKAMERFIEELQERIAVKNEALKAIKAKVVVRPHSFAEVSSEVFELADSALRFDHRPEQTKQPTAEAGDHIG